MSSDLPIDFSNPAIRDYLALTRLQVLTPLSLLINIATVGVCSLILRPSLGMIMEMYPTSITPSPNMIAIYVVAIYVTQIGYCVILVVARKSETKQALIKGSGYALVFSNWCMAFWAIAWTFQAFIVSSIFLGFILILLLYSNIVLVVYHEPTSKRPLDTALIHAPVRLFLILPMTLMLPLNIFLAVGHYWAEGDTKAYDNYMWEGFGVLFAMNVLGAIFIALRRDIVWTIGAAWLAASVWQKTPKSAPVIATAITFTFLHPVILIVSAMWLRLRKKNRHGPIALPEDAEDGIGSGAPPSSAHSGGRTGASRVWG